MRGQLTEILVILALLVMNGFFVAAEIALISARRSALKAAAEEGSRGAAVAVALTEDPSRFLAAIQIAITLLGFMASATAAVSLAEVLAGGLRSLDLPLSAPVVSGLSVFLVTVAVAYVQIVVSELAPKRLGLQRAETVAQRVSRPISAIAWLLSPVIWLLTKSADAVGWLIGVRGRGGKPGVTEEEIKLLVTEQGTLLDEEKRMIHEIFELGDTVVREIMVPRVDAVFLSDGSDLSQALDVFRTSGHSRLPVYHEDVDTVVGVLLLKDLLEPVSHERVTDKALDYARPPAFVPESKPILSLLAEMQTTRNPMAIVVDEYGGTAGLLTIEDIVEEIIGEVTDEYDKVQRFILPLGPGDWSVDGRLPVEEAREKLGVDVPDSDEYDTLAGWVLSVLGHIPVPGEIAVEDGFVIQVVTVRRRRIMRLRVTRNSRG